MDTEDVIDDQAIDDQAIDDTIDHARSCHATLLRLVLDKRARQAAAVAWMEQASPLVRAAIQTGVAECERERAERRVLASELHATEQLVARRSGLSTGDGLQEAAALRCELAAARSAWAAERAALRARLRLLGEQHNAARGAAAAGSGAAAAPRRIAAVAGGRAEAAGAQAASLTPSQDEAAVASLRAAMLASAQGGVKSRCGWRHEDEAPSCASVPTELSCTKWRTRYKVA